MLSINTNISSLIAQESMKSSTNKLDQAIERMTTGFKINHAKDNAANYSISTNMTTQLSAYDVAADNVAMGMDMVNTASDIISQMQDKGERLRALATQARNGTYGQQSLSAIKTEANAIISDIRRLYNTSEYNGIQLFDRQEYEIPNDMPRAKEEYGGFIANPKTYTDEYVDGLTSISKVVDSFDESIYKIASAEELAYLAELTNSGVDTTGVTFVLSDDIDLEKWCKDHESEGGWKPIGEYISGTDHSKEFKGTFDGNGHVISNLWIKREEGYQALFGGCYNANLKNIAIIDSSVDGKNRLSLLFGRSNLTNINNCYATGKIIEKEIVLSYTGGLGGNFSNAKISNCYSKTYITSDGRVGGLFGSTSSATIENCYAEGEVYGTAIVGGIIGQSWNTAYIDNSYSLLKAKDARLFGNIIGQLYRPNSTQKINNVSCYNSTVIGMAYDYDAGDSPLPDFDLSTKYSNVHILTKQKTTNELQIGINGESHSRLGLDAKFEYSLSLLVDRIDSKNALQIIDDFTSILSEKSSKLGAIQNRLDSALESISVNIENLTSSRSTIRDADMAEVSSEYIQQQILQQASATLMSTANQSPSIALQLI